MRNPLVWLLWAASAAVLALSMRNPLYLTLIVLATWLVYLGVAPDTPMAGGWRALLRLGLIIWLITIPFGALMNHTGEIVLLSLPENWPLIGGPVTLEAVLGGAASGYALWTLLFIFAAFNLATDASQLMRMAPAFLYQAGVVATIELTFVPQMLQSAREIREAQRIRGHHFRNWRDSLPLAMPLLTTAFEHAVQLAESMESRGLSGELTDLGPGRTRLLRGSLALGLLLLMAGLVLRITWIQAAGDGILLAGVLLMAGVFWQLGRHSRRTRYGLQIWGPGDGAVALGSVVALAAGVLAARSNPALVSYAPHVDGVLIPPFSPTLGLAVALLAVPGVVSLVQDRPPSVKGEDGRPVSSDTLP